MTYLCRIGRTSLGLPRQAKADMSIKTAQLPALCLLNQYGIKKLSTVSDNKSKKCLVKSGKDTNYPRAIFSFLLENFSCLISHFLLSAKEKFVTKFVTRITKFVTCVRKFVTAVTKFVIKNILADRKKYQGDNKNFQGARKHFQAARAAFRERPSARNGAWFCAESSFFYFIRIFCLQSCAFHISKSLSLQSEHQDKPQILYILYIIWG